MSGGVWEMIKSIRTTTMVARVKGACQGSVDSILNRPYMSIKAHDILDTLVK
jgi:hypothetical protein